jgi:hypothetical protein
MATEQKRAGKTEVLSMRIDPKTRFMLEVVSRYRGQSISTVVERAILEAADNLIFENDRKTWRDYWHAIDGVRAIFVAKDARLYPTFEEEERLRFTTIHWPFFYVDSTCKTVFVPYVEILWPKIDDYMDIWDKTRSAGGYHRAGHRMQEAIKEAGLSVPEWPVKKVPVKEPPKATVAPASGSGPSWDAPKGGDLDDEIPF